MVEPVPPVTLLVQFVDAERFRRPCLRECSNRIRDLKPRPNPLGNFTLVFDISHNNMISVHWRDVPEISKIEETYLSWFYVAISVWIVLTHLKLRVNTPAPRPNPIAMNETVFEHKHASLLSCWVVCFTLFCSNMFKPWDKGTSISPSMFGTGRFKFVAAVPWLQWAPRPLLRCTPLAFPSEQYSERMFQWNTFR